MGGMLSSSSHFFSDTEVETPSRRSFSTDQDDGSSNFIFPEPSGGGEIGEEEASEGEAAEWGVVCDSCGFSVPSESEYTRHLVTCAAQVPTLSSHYQQPHPQFAGEGTGSSPV